MHMTYRESVDLSLSSEGTTQAERQIIHEDAAAIEMGRVKLGGHCRAAFPGID